MNRREFINASVLAAMIGSVMAKRALAQGSTATVSPQSGPRFIGIDAYSRYLHWLRDPAEIAQACHELTLRSIMPTVGEGSSHVSLANVTTDLPRFVNAMRAEGIEVRQIRGGGQTDVDADVERLVATMADLGIDHYWLGTDRYDFSRPIEPQLDDIKRKVERFVALNERYGAKLQYHTRSNATSVGSVVWDLLYVMADFDPRFVGFHWDSGHMSNHGSMWETLIRTAGPYIATISWKDRRPVQNPDAADEQAVIATQQALLQAVENGQVSPDHVPELAGDHFGRGMGWNYQDVAIGTGLVDFFRYGEILQDMGFNGLMDLQAEYDYPRGVLGGAGQGRTELSLPREQVMGAIKRDVLTLRAALAPAGILI